MEYCKEHFNILEGLDNEKEKNIFLIFAEYYPDRFSADTTKPTFTQHDQISC